jgi:hypothetical protein
MKRLQEPEFTQNGYPTERTLETIREWPVFETGLQPLLEFIRKAWKYQEFANETNGLWEFVTGGWSGNEELLAALALVPCRGLATSYAEFSGGYCVIATSEVAASILHVALDAYKSVLQRYADVDYSCTCNRNYPDRPGGTKGGS